MKKYFSLPGYYIHFTLLKTFLNYKKEHPLYFIPEHIIESLYDAPPNFKWNGGREYEDPHIYSLDDILNWYFTNTTVSLRHTFTNLLLNNELIKDSTCNNFIQTKIRNDKDAIIIANPLLENYLNQNYPQINLIYSTTLNLMDITTVNNYSNKHMYVLNYNYNNDNSYLTKLIHRENIELLCAETCQSNCPYRKNHYYSISKDILNIPLDQNDIPSCPYRKHLMIFNSGKEELEYYLSLSHSINLNRLDELASMGFNHFKISGRSRPDSRLLYFLCYYLIKSEYLETSFQELLFLYEKNRIIDTLKSKIKRGC